MISRATVLCRAADVRYRIVGGEAVVLSQKRGEVVGLSEVGSRLLDLCDGERDLAAVLDLVGAEFEVERDQLERDAAEFLDQLVEIGVLIPNE